MVCRVPFYVLNLKGPVLKNLTPSSLPPPVAQVHNEPERLGSTTSTSRKHATNKKSWILTCPGCIRRELSQSGCIRCTSGGMCGWGVVTDLGGPGGVGDETTNYWASLLSSGSHLRGWYHSRGTRGCNTVAPAFLARPNWLFYPTANHRQLHLTHFFSSNDHRSFLPLSFQHQILQFQSPEFKYHPNWIITFNFHALSLLQPVSLSISLCRRSPSGPATDPLLVHRHRGCRKHAFFNTEEFPNSHRNLRCEAEEAVRSIWNESYPPLQATNEPWRSVLGVLSSLEIGNMAAASQHPSLPLSHSVSLFLFGVSLSLPRCVLVSLYLGTPLSHSFGQAQSLSLCCSHSAPHAPRGPSRLPLLGLKLR